MMTTVLAVLCLYLAACYAYGLFLLVGVVRGKSTVEAAPEASPEPAVAPGPRAGILRAATPPEAADRTAPPERAAA